MPLSRQQKAGLHVAPHIFANVYSWILSQSIILYISVSGIEQN